jgi:hypothetical protein
LWRSDFIRVPLPAARITAAKGRGWFMRGHLHGNVVFSTICRQPAAMPQFPFDTVAFDLDGTLADTAPDLAASLNHALVALGRAPVDPASVRYLVGHGARALLRRGLAATGDAQEELVERGFRSSSTIMPPTSATAPELIRRRRGLG